jgi:hypothetical protein
VESTVASLFFLVRDVRGEKSLLPVPAARGPDDDGLVRQRTGQGRDLPGHDVSRHGAVEVAARLHLRGMHGRGLHGQDRHLSGESSQKDLGDGAGCHHARLGSLGEQAEMSAEFVFQLAP